MALPRMIRPIEPMYRPIRLIVRENPHLRAGLATAFLRGKIAGVDSALDSVGISIRNVQRARQSLIVRWLRARVDRRRERELLEELVQASVALATLQVQHERLAEIRAKWSRQAAQRRRMPMPLWVPWRVRCRICGCTDERACPGGCSWVPDPFALGDLCSACAPAVVVEAAS